MAGTPQGGVISPLLSNIYLHVLDRRVGRTRCAHLGTLVRYADDFVVHVRHEGAGRGGRAAREHGAHAARARATSGEDEAVELSRGREGFDFLGCHLRKRMSGPIWERTRRRVYFLQRWPSQRAMKRMRQRVRELTPRARCHADLREVIADAQSGAPRLGQYFRTGNAATQVHPDRQLRRASGCAGCCVKRTGRHLRRRSRRRRGRRPFFEALGSTACAARFSIRRRRNAAT